MGQSSGGQAASWMTPAPFAVGAGQWLTNNSAAQAAEDVQKQGAAAINTLMGQYNTVYQMQAPVSNASVTATDQLNYLLGNQALAPGAAPVAPTAPTLASLESGISQTDINSYIGQNSILGPSGVFGYTGAGAKANAGTADSDKANAFEMQNKNAQYSGGDYGQGLDTLSKDPSIQAAVRAQLAQQQLADPNSAANVANKLAQTQYGQQQTAYNTANDLYNKYQGMGQIQPGQLSSIIQNQPGYQAQEMGGVNAIQNAAGAQGGLNSSNLLMNLNTFGQGLASQYYQNTLGNLATEAGLGQQATQGISNAAQNSGNAVAGILQGIGTTNANSAMAAAQNTASSWNNANQQFHSQNFGGGSSGLGNIAGAGIGLLGSQYGGSVLSAGMGLL